MKIFISPVYQQAVGDCLSFRVETIDLSMGNIKVKSAVDLIISTFVSGKQTQQQNQQLRITVNVEMCNICVWSLTCFCWCRTQHVAHVEFPAPKPRKTEQFLGDTLVCESSSAAATL